MLPTPGPPLLLLLVLAVMVLYTAVAGAACGRHGARPMRQQT